MAKLTEHFNATLYNFAARKVLYAFILIIF